MSKFGGCDLFWFSFSRSNWAGDKKCVRPSDDGGGLQDSNNGRLGTMIHSWPLVIGLVCFE